jgi:hypothetical protein
MVAFWIFPCYDDKAVPRRRGTQIGWEALIDYGPSDLYVEPVVVVPGWFVQPRSDPKKYPMKAMNALDVASYIARSTSGSDDQLKAVRSDWRRTAAHWSSD